MKFSDLPEHIQNQTVKEIVDLIHLYRLSEEKAKEFTLIVRNSISLLYEDDAFTENKKFTYKDFMEKYIQR